MFYTKIKRIQQRIAVADKNALDQRRDFIDLLQSTKLPNNSQAISVSVGDGIWDYWVAQHKPEVKKIIATDIVDCPVDKRDIKLLRGRLDWQFKKVKPEQKLPFPTATFDLAFHCDVVEHVRKPYLFLDEQYRVLKKGGYLLLNTPNLLRPVNLIKLLMGKLFFPINLGESDKLADCTHIQEFTIWGLTNMLEEVGFKIVSQKFSFFGIYPFNIRLSKESNTLTKQCLSHSLTILARK